MIVLKKYGTSLILIVIILILCFINPLEVPDKLHMTSFDKLVHFLMFFGLSCVIFFDGSLHLKQKVSRRLIVCCSFLFPIAFGGVIEIAQEYLTTTRSGDWMDVLFDGTGALCGCLVCLPINRKCL